MPSLAPAASSDLGAPASAATVCTLVSESVLSVCGRQEDVYAKEMRCLHRISFIFV